MTTYWNGPTAPDAVRVRSASTSLYVPLDCAEEDVVIVLEEQFAYETSVIFARTVFEALGALFVRATLNVSEPRLCFFSAISSVKQLKMLSVAILSV